MIPYAAIDRLLSPASLAVVGASARAGAGQQVLDNLQRFGYRGKVHLVSRRQQMIAGQVCLQQVDDLPEGIDVAILAIPQTDIQDTVDACIRRRIGGAVVFAAGYAETGDPGAEAQAMLAQTVRKAGFALLGPNCLGALNFTDGVPLTFETVQAHTVHGRQRVGILAQSGAMAANLRQALLSKGVNVVLAASTGNEAALTVEDLLDWLLIRDRVDLVVLFVEMLRQPRYFLRIAERARRSGKPIVLVHPGRSQKAREAARSHTGALAGDFKLMRTLVEREAVLVVDSLDEAFDTLTILSRYPPPTHGGIAVASNSGALRGLSIDLCQSRRLAMAALDKTTIARLGRILPDFATVDNPLDLTSAGMHTPRIFADAAATLLAAPHVGSLALLLMGGSAPQQRDKGEAILPLLSKADKPAVLVFMGDESPLDEAFKAQILASGVPFLRSPERALRALAHVHHLGDLLLAATRRASPAPVPQRPPLPPGPLAEHRAKTWLKTLGITVPAGALARTLDEALQIATAIGWPVVLKAQASLLTHKSDVGGVAINLADARALGEAWESMHAQLQRHCPGITLEGILVEQMAIPGLELMIGARRDPAWGVVLLVGLGGIWVEVLDDVHLLAADATETQIEHALRQLKSAALLDGIRGSPAVDVAAVARAVRRLGDAMLTHTELIEVDINPLLVRPRGQGVLALDAVMIAGDSTALH